MKIGTRSWFIGMHNPFFHSFFIIISWIKLYKFFPSFKELVCIFFHDIGYIGLDCIDCNHDTHPYLGANICGMLFGKKYYNFCISHSRDFVNKNGLKLSKLGYADKYSIIIMPNFILKCIIYLGGEANEYHRNTKTFKWGYPIEVKKIKRDYNKWWNENEM